MFYISTIPNNASQYGCMNNFQHSVKCISTYLRRYERKKHNKLIIDCFRVLFKRTVKRSLKSYSFFPPKIYSTYKTRMIKFYGLLGRCVRREESCDFDGCPSRLAFRESR